MPDINLTIGLVSLVVSILGVIIPFRIVRRPKPLYVIRTSKLGGIKHPEIKISFGGQRIDNLYATRLVFWNGGRKEIRNNDIPEPHAGPTLKISNNAKILSTIARTTTHDNSGEFIISKNYLSIDFDYLNRGDAFLGEVYITSNDGNKPNIEFIGNIKGESISEGDIYNLSIFEHFIFISTGIFLLYLTLIVGYQFFNSIILEQDLLLTETIAFLILLGFTIINFKSNIFSIPKKIPKKYLYFLESGEL